MYRATPIIFAKKNVSMAPATDLPQYVQAVHKQSSQIQSWFHG